MGRVSVPRKASAKITMTRSACSSLSASRMREPRTGSRVERGRSPCRDRRPSSSLPGLVDRLEGEEVGRRSDSSPPSSEGVDSGSKYLCFVSNVDGRESVYCVYVRNSEREGGSEVSEVVYL